MEVAHQREVPLGRERPEAFSSASFRLAERGPERPRKGKVEVHPGDDLHHPAVAMAQSAPVHVLHHTHVGAAVARDRDRAVAGDHARHARRPQHFVVDQRIGELVQMPEAAGRLAHAAPGGGHELEQRLGEVGGDGGVGEGGAERRRVGPLGDVAGAVDAQTLLLHPDPPSRERARTEGLDEVAHALLHGAGQVENLRARTAAGTTSADSARDLVAECIDWRTIGADAGGRSPRPGNPADARTGAGVRMPREAVTCREHPPAALRRTGCATLAAGPAGRRAASRSDHRPALPESRGWWEGSRPSIRPAAPVGCTRTAMSCASRPGL